MPRHQMRIGGADANRGARGDAITAIFEIRERAARKARHRGHEPQRFFERPFGHFELAEAVVPDALTRRRDAQHLLAQPVLPFGMAREFPDQRGDRAGDRVVRRHHQEVHMIDDRLDAHIVAIVVARAAYLAEHVLAAALAPFGDHLRSEAHTSELQSLMRISYAAFCLKKKNEHPSLISTTY